MWRVITSTFAALTLFSTVAAAQQPCTTDANRVVAEVYRHTLERGADQGSQTWVRQVANGSLTVKELVRRVVKSQEYMQRFGQTEPGEGQPYERAVARLYRHVLARQPDAGGLRSWARNAQQRGLAAVVDGLIDSAEYNNNFGEQGVPGSGGLRFCANEQSGNVSAGPINNRRFQNMDVNNDNVVSRREWRGSVESFRSHDWNNDGVLSGNEVATGGFRQGQDEEFEDFDRAEEFEWLDANNNNRIEEDEWHASLRAFDQLDRNNDSVLSRAEFIRAGTAATTGRNGRTGQTGQTIAVGGDRQWVDTGINVRAGQTLTITASGQIRVARDGGSMSAAGISSGRTEGATMPTANVGGLVARFGESAPLFIGDSRTFTTPRGGRLYLGVNDSFFDDNTGQYMVRVDVN